MDKDTIDQEKTPVLLGSPFSFPHGTFSCPFPLSRLGLPGGCMAYSVLSLVAQLICWKVEPAFQESTWSRRKKYISILGLSFLEKHGNFPASAFSGVDLSSEADSHFTRASNSKKCHAHVPMHMN